MLCMNIKQNKMWICKTVLNIDYYKDEILKLSQLDFYNFWLIEIISIYIFLYLTPASYNVHRGRSPIYPFYTFLALH